jgi:hypothetical protein
VILVDEGRLVFSGVPDDLIAAGGTGVGDSPAERGYSELLRAFRNGGAA